MSAPGGPEAPRPRLPAGRWPAGRVAPAAWTLGLALALAPALGCNTGRGSGEPGALAAEAIPDAVVDAERGAMVAANEALHLTVALPLRNEDELERLLADLYDPKSPRFHHFWSPEDFAHRFHPRRREVEAVRAALAPYNIRCDAAAHGAFLGIHGAVADVEAAFQVTLYHMVDAEGRAFVAPDVEPSAPGALHLVALHGLVSGLLPEPLYPRPLTRVFVDEPSVPGLLARRGADEGLDATVLRRSYCVPQHMRGRGQSVGLFQLDHFDPNDLALYAARNGLPMPRIHTVYLDGATADIEDPEIQGEVTLDIEMLMAMAPDLEEIRLYQGRWAKGVLGRSYYFNVFNEMANPSVGDRKLVRSLSTSYGYSESDLSPAERRSEHNLFRQLAAQGQSLFSAAGDTGALDTRRRVAVVDPAIQPYVVAVGGTQLQADRDGNFDDEHAWAGSGGGVSEHWPLPAYQEQMVRDGRQAASFERRNAPDVAFNADPNSGFLVTLYGNTYRMGGTSAAAPLWAGVLGLINGARAERGLLPLGFFNPTLYRLATTGNYAALFYDTTVGDNGRYRAGRGYDNVTGWGTPKVDRVIDAMSRGYARHPVAGADWLE